jgi:hypothetical protein
MRKPAWMVIPFAASVAVAAAAWAQAPQLALLDRLERGAWTLTYRGDEDGAGKVCVATGRELIQLRHARLNCRSVIVEDTPHAVTVQYSCPGNGYGRTHIRRESDRLVQVDTQGIENGLPFAFAAEARWVGSCSR